MRSHKSQPVADEAPDEIFKMVSRGKYSQYTNHRSATNTSDTPVVVLENATSPADIELIRDRHDITSSLQALAEKYSLSEITLATDDGLVLATSAQRDVQIDAVNFSQIARQQALSDEPDVTLFELMHRKSQLIGIIRTSHDLPQNWKRQIRDDTKVILQWWL